VVVGTVIDSDLRDEVRVTVIVTGLGRKQVAAALKMPAIEMVKPQEAPVVDYAQLDRPAVMRRQGVTSTSTVTTVTPPQSTSLTSQRPATAAETTHDIDYLDIPAFLRRKEEEVIS
jgi:cell division protein FtsZ